MVLFGLFSLILVMVYWVNRAVILFDQLIADGQSAMVFVEFTALTLPNVIRLVLPLSAFAAAVYVTNRLSSESELVVMQATGFSSFRLARPVLVFGCLVALLIAVLSNFLVPLAAQQLADRRTEIAENVTARLLTEGSFLHPADGIAFYIREISPRGELRDIFLSDVRNPAERTVYTARKALLVRPSPPPEAQTGASADSHDAVPAGPKLVMFDGMAQILRVADQSLSVTRFTDFTYDISSLINIAPRLGRTVDELSTVELLTASPTALKETGATRAMFMAKGNERLSQPLFAVMAALLGFSALLIGGFSRFGVWRQTLLAVVVLIIVKSLDNLFTGMIRVNGDVWPLAYLPPLLGMGIALALLYVSEHPALLHRRSEVAA